jgi:hypothetical protein
VCIYVNWSLNRIPSNSSVFPATLCWLKLAVTVSSQYQTRYQIIYSYVQSRAVITFHTTTGDKTPISPADHHALLMISIPTHVVPRMSSASNNFWNLNYFSVPTCSPAHLSIYTYLTHKISYSWPLALWYFSTWNTQHSILSTYRILRKFLYVLLPLLLALTTHLRVLASSFLRFRDHTQWHDTVGRTPLDEWSARRRDLYLTNTQLTTDNYPCPRRDSNPQSQQA